MTRGGVSRGSVVGAFHFGRHSSAVDTMKDSGLLRDAGWRLTLQLVAARSARSSGMWMLLS